MCEAIRYEATGDPVVTFKCHCRSCQRFTGSAYMPGILVPAGGFKVTRGEPVVYSIKGDSGDDIRRAFCGVCGSPLYATYAHMPDLVGLCLTNLEDSSRHVPTMELYTSHAQPWDIMSPDTKKFAEMPPRR